uniref:BMERB domain-containing protein n=1 Tax=Panagrellus redivivus TaxID=6233 RepID=A0A7E4UML5_PANRE
MLVNCGNGGRRQLPLAMPVGKMTRRDPRKYARPLTCSEVMADPVLTQEDINIEIAKQQALLEEVNDQQSKTSLMKNWVSRVLLNRVLELRKQNKDTKLKQQEMWDVQQCITLLKRKLKNLSRNNGSTDDENASTSSDTSSVIEPGPLLERQLIAIQKVLIEDIVDEENEIAQLQQKLFDLQVDLDTHKDQITQSSVIPPPPSNGTLTRRPRMAPPPPPQVPIWDPAVVSTIGKLAQDLVEPSDSDCNECHRQEVRKSVLVSQLAKMRDECAQLRAKLDDSRETKQAVVVAAADDFGTSNVLITKL